MTLTGRLLRIKGLTRDITQRKKAELVLEERNVQLALAAKTGLVGSFAYDTHTEIMQISEGYVAIHGFPGHDHGRRSGDGHPQTGRPRPSLVHRRGRIFSRSGARCRDDPRGPEPCPVHGQAIRTRCGRRSRSCRCGPQIKPSP